MELKELLQAYGMSIADASRYFDIPYRSLQNWCRGERTAPSYIIKMMSRILELEQAKK